MFILFFYVIWVSITTTPVACITYTIKLSLLFLVGSLPFKIYRQIFYYEQTNSRVVLGERENVRFKVINFVKLIKCFFYLLQLVFY